MTYATDTIGARHPDMKWYVPAYRRLMYRIHRWFDRRIRYQAIRHLSAGGERTLESIKPGMSETVPAAIRNRANETRREQHICSALMHQ